MWARISLLTLRLLIWTMFSFTTLAEMELAHRKIVYFFLNGPHGLE